MEGGIKMFDDKVVIITGAAQGIGRGVAQVYAENGAHVILADNNESLGRQTEESLLQQGYSCLFIKTDVRVEKDVINLMEQTSKEFGTIDILINNAGNFNRARLTTYHWMSGMTSFIQIYEAFSFVVVKQPKL